MKSKAAGCGSISTVISSMVLLCVSSIIIRLVDQTNTVRRNSWMTELGIEELERKVTGSDSVIVEEARSAEALPDHVGEDVRIALLEMGAEEQADSLDEEEIAIVMEIVELIERGRKDKLPAKEEIIRGDC